MVAKRLKKYSVGEGAAFMTRKKALKYLQLTLKDFRKLCILKGVYPREPRHRRRAQQGASGVQTLYLKKDIQFLAADPIIWKMREYKPFFRRVAKARSLNYRDELKRLLNNHPYLTLDRIVKERYPSFIDALRDLDDCLTLSFLFSTFPVLKNIPRNQAQLCRRLTVEFLHAVIMLKALRKVFVSIKGYYYQAEIRGQTINWIVPHHFSFQAKDIKGVDFKVMSHFVEFYTVMLGFVNYRLFTQSNVAYPPRLSNLSVEDGERALADEEVFVEERIASLNVKLDQSGPSSIDEEGEQLDEFESVADKNSEAARAQLERTKRIKTLFKGLKIFVNREVPREPIVICVRALGGEVSWDKSVFVGATFNESDESITHQIVDRPEIDNKYLSRYYVQPQWIFDCVNAAALLPAEKYFLGKILPPHLSPFAHDVFDQLYRPPEEEEMKRDAGLIELNEKDNQDVSDSSSDEDEEQEEEQTTKSTSKKQNAKQKKNSQDTETEDLTSKTPEQRRQILKKKMSVDTGKVEKEDPAVKRKEAFDERKLAEKMIHNKHRKLYHSMMKGRKNREKEAWLLKKKRTTIDEQATQEKKLARKEEKKKLKKELASA